MDFIEQERTEEQQHHLTHMNVRNAQYKESPINANKNTNEEKNANERTFIGIIQTGKCSRSFSPFKKAF